MRGDEPMTDFTGMLLTQAVRTVAEVLASMAGMDLPTWPEKVQATLNDPVDSSSSEHTSSSGDAQSSSNDDNNGNDSDDDASMGS